MRQAVMSEHIENRRKLQGIASISTFQDILDQTILSNEEKHLIVLHYLENKDFRYLNKTDLVVIGIKEISFVSALTDAVMINEFLYRVIVRYILDTIDTIDVLHIVDVYGFLNNLFPLAVGVIMAIVPFFMLRRYIKYEV